MANLFIHQDSKLVVEIAGKVESFDLFGNALAVGNFDGKRGDDLAIGVIGEDIGTIKNAGAINVIYSNSNGVNGINGINNQSWHQDSAGVLGIAEEGDRFGNSVAAGDFNGDGKDDLAIGVSGEDIGTIQNAGAVNVLYGSSNGLTASNDQSWHQNSAGVLGIAEAWDGFGNSVAAGDFDGDGKDDLAIGVSGEDIGTTKNAGAVNVLYGSSNGLTASNDQSWHQDSAGVLGIAEEGDRFGNSVATGDFNGDGKDDLAIGVSGEDIGTIKNAGAVNVLYGSSNGLTASNDQSWYQNSIVEGSAEAWDGFGNSVATGDFNGDGKDDLAIGVSGEDIGTIKNAGAVNILYGSSNGLTASNDQIWHQNSTNIEGGSETGDQFGASLGVGDFNGDGKDDLAIGVSGEDIGNIKNAGAVNVIYGSSNGLSSINDQIWHQDRPNIKGKAEPGDLFGSSLSVGDFNRDGFDDLAIGVKGEGIGTIQRSGSVQILFGSASGLTALSPGEVLVSPVQ